MSLSWHLAIESSGLGGSVALFEYDGNFHGQLHSQLILPNSMGSVRTLAPAIEQLLREAQLLVKQLGSLSVTNGPGSFTGLRVGLATAKLFAWTQRIPVVPVDTLEAIANRFAQASSRDDAARPATYNLVAAINAFRRQVFTSSWRIAPSGMECLQPSSVVDANQWLANPLGDHQRSEQLPLWVTGPALSSYSALDGATCQLGTKRFVATTSRTSWLARPARAGRRPRLLRP